MLYEVYRVEIERTFFEQRTRGDVPDEHVRTEGIYFFFYGSLEAGHDQERDDGGAESNRDGDDSDLVDCGRERARLLPADSFRYEIRKVQNYGVILRAHRSCFNGGGAKSPPSLCYGGRSKISK